MTVALRSVNNQLIRSTNYGLFNCDLIAIDVSWGKDRKSPVLIKIQGTEMDTLEKALEHLEYLLAHMRCVRTFVLNVESSNTKEIDALIEKFLDAENVRLEVLKVRRRYVGQRFNLLPDLIFMNADSLKIITKIGLSEAVEAFNEKIRLDRLSLMNFDLIQDGELESQRLDEQTRDCIRRLGGLGATFSHLSYTSYSGFDISKNPTLFMLKQCEVRSLKLTMQKGRAITEPINMGGPVRPLLSELERLELVGNLCAPRERLTALFPALNFYNFQKQDLCAGSPKIQVVC